MPTVIVIWIAKLAGWLSNRLGKGEGGALPGLIAERLQPRMLEKLGKQLNGGSILVTGTNGKTTTTRMVAAIMEEKGKRLLVNRAGSNLTRGLVSYLIGASSWSGRLKVDMAVFEVDEAAFAEAFRALKPRAVLVLNLFRDQLDRYGELNTLAQKIQAAIQGSDTKLILNADDPLVAWLGIDSKPVIYFGMASAPVAKLAHDFAADSHGCPVCGAGLRYINAYYAHIGDYSCPNGNFKRPHIDVVGNATKINLSSATMTVSDSQDSQEITLGLPGIYNLYNALAVIALGQSQGIDLTTMVQRLKSTKAAFGRAEVIELSQNRRLRLLLVKNPTGFNQVIQTYEQESISRPMMIVINDRIADGRDVSWLWDVAAEDLTHNNNFLVSGTRAYDMALRLKYADKDAEIATNLETAISQFIKAIPVGAEGLILPTYTAMLETRAILGSVAKIGRMDQ